MKAVAAWLLLLIAALLPPFYAFTLRVQRAQATWQAETEIDELDSRLQQSLAVQRKRAQFDEEVRELQSKLAHIDGMLPAKLDEAAMKKLLTDAATVNNLTIDSLDSAKPAVDVYAEQEHTVTVGGSLDSIRAFAKELESLKPLRNIKRIELRPEGDGWVAVVRVTSFALHR